MTGVPSAQDKIRTLFWEVGYMVSSLRVSLEDRFYCQICIYTCMYVFYALFICFC